MATINDLDKTDIGEGILMPQLVHQWRLRFAGKPSLFTEHELTAMAMQVVGCSFDYCLNVFGVEFEQDKFTTRLHDLVKRFSALSKKSSNDEVSFIVDMMDGDGTVLKSFKFSNCALVGHSFNLNYAESGTAKHKVKFSFKTSKEI